MRKLNDDILKDQAESSWDEEWLNIIFWIDQTIPIEFFDPQNNDLNEVFGSVVTNL